MKSKALNEALRLVTKTQLDPRLGPGQGDQLRKVKRELETMARSGKFDRDRLFRSVEVVATILLETLNGTQI